MNNRMTGLDIVKGPFSSFTGKIWRGSILVEGGSAGKGWPRSFYAFASWSLTLRTPGNYVKLIPAA